MTLANEGRHWWSPPDELCSKMLDCSYCLFRLKEEIRPQFVWELQIRKCCVRHLLLFVQSSLKCISWAQIQYLKSLNSGMVRSDHRSPRKQVLGTIRDQSLLACNYCIVKYFQVREKIFIYLFLKKKERNLLIES